MKCIIGIRWFFLCGLLLFVQVSCSAEDSGYVAGNSTSGAGTFVAQEAGRVASPGSSLGVAGGGGSAAVVGSSAGGVVGTILAGSGRSANVGGQGGGGIRAVPTEKFSFFVTSMNAIQRLSKSENGFGGDLRFGETGNGAGLRGADKICSTIAETTMPGASAKIWKAFLSAANYDENGKPGQVNAIDRIGNGPWYDRKGRVFAVTKTDLLFTRPRGADPAIINDFPNEDGVPNHDPDLTGIVDNHDMLTGTDIEGKLYDPMSTCLDWTTSDGALENGFPRVGHSWPRAGGPPGGPGTGGGGSNGNVNTGMEHWMSALDEAGCAAGINIIELGGPIPLLTNFVGSGGGYGGFYCFALTP
jgi:hypothetical protein